MKKLYRQVEKELVREGVFRKGGYMDITQYVREEEHIKGLKKGLRKGRQEGRKELVLKMLKEKMDITLVFRLTGLSIKEVKKLKNGS